LALSELEQQKPVTNFLQNIDDETMRRIMEYFHLKDYDAIVNYAVAIGVSLLPKTSNPSKIGSSYNHD
jgi:hypothetical protein